MMTSRDECLTKLSSQRFDLLIIGGGIVGAGIARDAAMRGLKVALIEQGDFSSGTSSKTSKLVHGGLRYLEHGHLSLVRESLRERHTLRTIAPELVYPLSLLLPIYRGDLRAPWKIHTGLWLYDLLGGGRGIESHRMLSARSAATRVPQLSTDGLRAAGVFADCQMDDARLCLANVLQATEFGAVCVNYVRLRTFMTANGRVCGGVAEEIFTGRQVEIQARVVLNATGPWTDGIRSLSDEKAPARLEPTKGIHLIVPRLTRHALFVQANADGRMLFVLPWGDDYTLIGTTETALDAELDALAADANDVGYLLEAVNRVLPERHLAEGDIIATFAGARPLLASAGSSTSASREHRIDIDRRGLGSVLGGKFTAYRRMAQEAVDVVMRQLRFSGDRCLTDQVRLLESVEPVALDQWRDMTRRIDDEQLARLLIRYGAKAFHILKLLARAPVLNRPVCPHHDVLEVELVHAIQEEMVCTITDLLARRTRIAWSSCQGLDALSTVIELFQQHTGLSDHQLEAHVHAYHHFLAQSLQFRQPRHRTRATPSRSSTAISSKRMESFEARVVKGQRGDRRFSSFNAAIKHLHRRRQKSSRVRAT